MKEGRAAEGFLTYWFLELSQRWNTFGWSCWWDGTKVKICCCAGMASEFRWTIQRMASKRPSSAPLSFSRSNSESSGTSTAAKLMVAASSWCQMVAWKFNGETLGFFWYDIVASVFRQICAAKFSLVRSYRHSDHLVLTGCTRMPGKGSKFCYEHKVVNRSLRNVMAVNW